MPFSRQEQDRQRQRDEARRQEAITRRQGEERDAAREEARREESRQARLAFEAEQEASRARREALLARIRDERRRERAAAEHLAAQRSDLLDRIREASATAKRAAGATSERRERLRTKTEVTRRDDDRRAERQTERAGGPADARRAAARELRAAAKHAADRRSVRRATARTARGADQRGRSSGARHEQPADAAMAAGPADDRSRLGPRKGARTDRADHARRDTVAAERAAAARETRRSTRLEESRAKRRQENATERAEAGALADRRERRRVADRLSRTGAEQAAQRRERPIHERASTVRTLGKDPRRRPETPPSRSIEPSGPGSDPLVDPIPSGVLSGSLPWLRVEGTRLVTLAGHPVTLRGVNVAGLGPPDRGHDLVAAGLDEAGLEALLALGAGTVRVPIDRDRLLVGDGDRSGLDHLAELDRVIDQVASAGAYTILSLRTLGDATFGTVADGSGGLIPNLIAPQPDFDCIGLWSRLGERYASEPAVLFDLFAAPHAALPDDPSGTDTDWDRWALWIRLTVARLRLVHPRAVSIVAGLEWGTDLGGFPVLGTANEPIPNLVYGATLSADRPDPPLRVLASRLPILVTEFETAAAAAAVRAASLAAMGVGWIVAARPDRPLVAAVRGGRFEPTVLGTSIRRAIAAIPERPLVEPLRRPAPALTPAV